MLRKVTLFIILLLLIFNPILFGGKYTRPDKPMKYWTKEEFNKWNKHFNSRSLAKPTDHDYRQFGLHNGNKLRTLFYNFGSIGRPNTEPSIEWPAFSGNGYAYEFGLMVGAEVAGSKGQTLQIISDAMIDGGDTDPTGGKNVWGWEPVPGWAVSPDKFSSWPQSEKEKGGIAMSNRPITWGNSFPKDSEGNLLWPGLFGDGIVTADLESYYVMDDRFNKEFDYFPFPDDSSKKGIGIQVIARGYQYAASIAEDIIFFRFEIKNTSPKRLENVVVGMIGDPHIGGAGDFSDDFAGFIGPDGVDSYTGETHDVKNMVYAWDNIGSSNDFSITWDELGWLGFKFLESPGNAEDEIDNDNDGMIDESRTDGIDNDGDWDATDETAAADIPEDNWWNGIDDDGDGRIDDLGDIDKKSDDVNLNDTPDNGEPDFDGTDIDESDQLGLTSFAAPIYATEVAADDDIMWNRLKPGNYQKNFDQNVDNIFIFGSGYFPLNPGQSEFFCVAILMGQNKDDLLSNAKTAEWIYRLGFQFTKPPDPPKVWAVAGDKKVTLYWDDTAEHSVDPVFGKDFEGYKIYRSTKKGYWGQQITDNQGVIISNIPIAQFDLNDDISGTHPVEWIQGLHFYTGNNTGLVHSYVDSNLVNGLVYYYAVTAYDKGSIEGNVTPFECTKSFGSPNVVSCMPNAEPSGFINPDYNLDHYGLSTANVNVKIIDRTKIDDSCYQLCVDDTSQSEKLLNVFHITDIDTEVIWQNLSFSKIKNVWNSKFLAGPYEISIDDVPTIKVDSVKWIFGNEVLKATVVPYSNILIPRDYEIHFYDHMVYTSLITNIPVNFRAYRSEVDSSTHVPLIFFDNDGDQILTKGDKIVFIEDSLNILKSISWQFTFSAPADTTIVDTTPQPGSVIKLYTAKPLSSQDFYKINGVSHQISNIKASAELDRIAVVPNPYVSASSFETPPPEVFDVGRGTRRVDFIHLPQKCTIKIFTIAGEHVRTLEHFGTNFDGTEPWDLLSKDGLDIAYGIYIYHIDAGEIGTKIGRLAILK